MMNAVFISTNASAYNPIKELKAAVRYLYGELACGAEEDYLETINWELTDPILALLGIDC